MDIQLLLPLVLLFGSIATASAVIATYALRRTSPIDRRLRGMSDTGTAPAATGALDLAHVSYGGLQKLAGALPKSYKQLSALRRRLASAGYERPKASVLYAIVEKGLPIVA